MKRLLSILFALALAPLFAAPTESGPAAYAFTRADAKATWREGLPADCKEITPTCVYSPSKGAVYLLAELCGLDEGYEVEFFLLGALSDRAYEGLAIAWDAPSTIVKAFSALGMPTGSRADPQRGRAMAQGERVTMTIKRLGEDTDFRPLSDFVDDQCSTPAQALFERGFPYIGTTGFDDAMPASIIAAYTEPYAILGLPYGAPKSNVYGLFRSKVSYPAGTPVVVALNWQRLPDGQARVLKRQVTVDAKAIADADPLLAELRTLCEDPRDIFLDVRLAPSLTLAQVRPFAALLVALEAEGGLVLDVPAPGQLNLRAFLPNPDWLDRSTRVFQPWEIEIASDKKALEKGKADVWSSGKQISDQQLNVEPQGAPLQSGASYWWRVRVWTGDDKVTSWSDPAYFSLGPDSSQWKGQWITAEWTEGAPLPYFRKTFDISKAGTKPIRAVVYLSGLGCSDLFFNGQRVDSTRILDPAQTNYEQYAFYSTFDVTPLLQKGNNCIGVMLGDGWYSQGKVWGPGFSYGKPILFAQMDVSYKDGSTLTVATDETWEWAPGPILSTNIYAGEVYDANKEIEGWAEADTQLEGWKPARIASGVIPQRLEPQLIEPIRMQEIIEPIDLWQTSSGSWIFDFGVNVAGIPLLNVELPQGTRLKMQMGELLDSARTIDFSTTGPAATGVIQTDEYICTGKGEERWTPRFTYHGFRYLELSGVAGQPDPSWIKVVTVYTDVDERGSFECSDPTINRLHELAIRTMLSNIHGLPTDCPHRERIAVSCGPSSHCSGRSAQVPFCRYAAESASPAPEICGNHSVWHCRWQKTAGGNGGACPHAPFLQPRHNGCQAGDLLKELSSDFVAYSPESL